MTRRLAALPLLLILLLVALPAAADHTPGHCPAGYTSVDFSGSLSWTADADYSSVILVGGPPGPDRDQTFTDVSAGDVLTRSVHEISHICVIAGTTTTTEGPTSTTSPTTTTPTTVPSTTTTEPDGTTTTEITPSTSTTLTTAPETTTTSVAPGTTSVTSPSTSGDTSVPPSTPTTATTQAELPYTGADLRLLASAGLTLLLSGLSLIRRGKEEE